MHRKCFNKRFLLGILFLCQTVITYTAQTADKQQTIPPSHEDEFRRLMLDPQSSPSMISKAFVKGLDPFVCSDKKTVLESLECKTNELAKGKSPLKCTLEAKIKLLKKYSTAYLRNLIDQAKGAPSIKDYPPLLQQHTPLPDVLISLVNDYIGQTWKYRVGAAAMRYISRYFIDQDITIVDQKIVSALPYVADEQDQNLFYYTTGYKQWRLLIQYGVDPLDTTLWEHIFLPPLDTEDELRGVKIHATNLAQGHVRLLLARDGLLLSKAIQTAVNDYHGTDQWCSAQERVPQVLKRDSYQLVQAYLTFSPEILTYHDEEHRSIFDFANASCPDNKEFTSERIDALVKLFMDQGADPNMQDRSGNTFLHRLVSNGSAFTCYPRYHPNDSPFIKRCASLVDLAIKNKAKKTVLDILDVKINHFETKKEINTRQAYQQFKEKLLKIKPVIRSSASSSPRVNALLTPEQFAALNLD